MAATCDWCGESSGGAACGDCDRVACDSCLARAVAAMGRTGVPDAEGCPFCVGAFPDLRDLVAWVCDELEISPDELVDEWRESRRP